MVERTLNEELASQGAADTEVDIDEAMARKLVQMQKVFEPFAVDHGTGDNLMLMSIAISLKRLADSQFNVVTAINALPGEVTKMAPAIKTASDAVVSALRNIEFEIRSTEDRKINLHISKD